MSVRPLALLSLVGTLALALPQLVLADATRDFVEAQKHAARQMTQEDSLAQALALWRTLLPLDSTQDETRKAIADLERDIASRVKTLLRSAERAYASGRPSEGDDYMLKVLALQPDQTDALARLRKSHSAFARRQQREKSAEEYQSAASKVAPLSPVDDSLKQLKALERKRNYSGMLALAESSGTTGQAAAAPLLRDAHVALADKAERSGKLDDALLHMESAMNLQPVENDPLLDRIATLRGWLSTSWYEKGSRLIKVDLPAAIDALRKAISFNPYNDNARRKLAQAEMLQRNLNRIEGAR
jgi:tetratricopeptide (TPR) repeat protein